jgi:hypothetical protein
MDCERMNKSLVLNLRYLYSTLDVCFGDMHEFQCLKRENKKYTDILNLNDQKKFIQVRDEIQKQLYEHTAKIREHDESLFIEEKISFLNNIKFKTLWEKHLNVCEKKQIWGIIDLLLQGTIVSNLHSNKDIKEIQQVFTESLKDGKMKTPQDVMSKILTVDNFKKVAEKIQTSDLLEEMGPHLHATIGGTKMGEKLYEALDSVDGVSNGELKEELKKPITKEEIAEALKGIDIGEFLNQMPDMSSLFNSKQMGNMISTMSKNA